MKRYTPASCFDSLIKFIRGTALFDYAVWRECLAKSSSIYSLRVIT